MKKYFYIAILLISSIVFSSCIIVTDDFIDHYSITFVNDTPTTVADWYLRTHSGNKIAKSDNWESVSPHSQSTLPNVRENYYQIYYCFDSNIKQYYYTNYILLDSNTRYSLKNDDFYSRAPKGTATPHFYLEDDKGNKIQLNIGEIK